MRNIHVVSHTHWDREWYRSFQDFRLKLVHLVDGLLDLLEKDPKFKYFMLDGQTTVLEDYLVMRPENEALLRKHIQKGRILIGPWHILPDMFLVGPEAHIRNLLQGERTARRFGPKMMIGYIPDPFGHPGQIPQILRGFGIETACLWRGLDDQPAEFWWQSPDGSRVLMAYLRDSYSNGASLPADNLAAFTSGLALAADALEGHSAVPDRLVMYGTDHMEPSRNTSKAIAYADKNLPGSRVLHSTIPQYVASVQSAIKKRKLDLPIVEGELRAPRRMPLLPGVLSTRMWIKQRNHAGETLLLKWVEPFTALHELVVGDQPASPVLIRKSALVRQAWHLLMENHPHDSICGCSIDQVHREMNVRFDQVEQIGEELTRQSLEGLANSIQTRSAMGDAAVLVFNPTSQPRSDMAEATLELPPGTNEFDLLDEAGKPIPYQTHGLGSREIVNMNLDLKGFQAAFGSISDGRAAGMVVKGIQQRREGGDVFIDAIMADSGDPDLVAWAAARRQVDEYVVDPSITTYHVKARSTDVTRLLLAAPDVPGLGYRTFWVRPRRGSESAPMRLSPLVKALLPLARLPILQKLATRKRYARAPYRIENDHFRVEAKRDGTLTLFDKHSQRTYPGLNCFRDGGDCGDEYNFCPPAADRQTTDRLRRASIRRGPVQQSLELELELTTPAGLSPDRKARSKEKVKLPITTTVTLTEGVSRLDIHTTVANLAGDHRLRVHFPAPFAAAAGQYDGHFDVVERKVGLPASDATWVELPRPEVPQRAFSDVSDGQTGLMVANRGLPEVEVLKNAAGNAEIAVTLLRCVGWLSREDFPARNGHAGPAMETPEAQMPGSWSFDYSVIPHEGNWESACQQAYAFETPLRAFGTDLHDGKLPAVCSFLNVEPGSFVISALKESEDGHGWVARGYNPTGREIEVTLRPWKAFKKVELVDLAEKRIASLKPARDGQVGFRVDGHAIASVRFQS